MTSPAPGELSPRYLTAADYPWLRHLLDELERFVGRRRVRLAERLREPVGMSCDPGKLRLAVHVLERLCPSATVAAVAPRQVRAALFRAASRSASEADAEACAAEQLGLDVETMRRSLFADLPSEQRLGPLPAALGPAELAARVNVLLVQRLLARASFVRLALRGHSRAVVRQAKLRGLLCVVRGPFADDQAELELSGPLAIFHHSLLYGRALGALVPHLAWCRSFVLRALCEPRDRADAIPQVVRVQSGDPIFPAVEPARFDSKLEAQFARAFARAAPDWDIVREPEPIAAGSSWVFPDFELRHRRDPTRRWLLEVAGFWTDTYLEHKLEALRRVKLTRFILCIDEERACAAGLPAARWPSDGSSSRADAARLGLEGLHLVRFRRRVAPQSVLAIVDPVRGCEP